MVRPGFLAQKHAFELIHARIGKQESGVRLRDQRRTRHGMVLMFLEILDEGPPKCVRAMLHEAYQSPVSSRLRTRAIVDAAEPPPMEKSPFLSLGLATTTLDKCWLGQLCLRHIGIDPAYGRPRHALRKTVLQ